MKKALLVLLVALVIVTGLPVLMGMPGMATGTGCGPAMAPMCLAVVLAPGAAAAILVARRRVRRPDGTFTPLLRAFVVERPPRFA